MYDAFVALLLEDSETPVRGDLVAGLEASLHPALVVGSLVGRDNAPGAAGTAVGAGAVADAVGKAEGGLVCELDRLRLSAVVDAAEPQETLVGAGQPVDGIVYRGTVGRCRRDRGGGRAGRRGRGRTLA